MSIENGDIPTSAERKPVAGKNLWDVQIRLVSEFQDLQSEGASREELAAKSDEIAANVTNLLEAGEVEAEAAWALGADMAVPDEEDER